MQSIDARRYSRTAIVLHWLLALLLAGQMAFGWLLEEVPRNTAARAFWVNQHKSAGLLIGLLVLLRLAWRLAHAPPPPLPMPRWQRRAASLVHWALYAAMLLMPLSGYLASNVSKYGVKLFNRWLLPPWGAEDKAVYAVFNQIHQATALLLALLIGVHLLAVFKHQLVDRDRLLSRMWGWRRQRPGGE